MFTITSAKSTYQLKINNIGTVQFEITLPVSVRHITSTGWFESTGK
jgi:hypothetical protein